MTSSILNRAAWHQSSLIAVAVAAILTSVSSAAEKADTPKTEPAKYPLRYKFQPGETLRWTVTHRCRVRTSVSGTTQEAETTTTSQKAWRVGEVRPDGSVTFEHFVEWIDMRHKLTGRDEVHYDSRKDLVAPAGFEDVARAVGVTLSTVTMDQRGKTIRRKRNPLRGSVESDGEMTITLPKNPVAVGEQWSIAYDIDVPLPGGAGVRRVKAQQVYKLENVQTGVASIHLVTQILTPIHDPALESQLVKYETSGTVRFDVEAGRLLGQQMDVDKGVVGFRGEASSVRYSSRFSEELVRGETTVASRSKP
jgi:hypothetical protein